MLEFRCHYIHCMDKKTELGWNQCGIFQHCDLKYILLVRLQLISYSLFILLCCAKEKKKHRD